MFGWQGTGWKVLWNIGVQIINDNHIGNNNNNNNNDNNNNKYNDAVYDDSDNKMFVFI